MMVFEPRPLTMEEQSRLYKLTDGLVGDYAGQVAAIDAAWSSQKLGTARDAAFEARPRGDRCVYCQDNEGRELDHLRPKTLYPWLVYCWTNLIPACSTCGGADYKGAKDAVLDPMAPSGWREITRPRGRKGQPAPVSPPPDGPTAWWNPRLADPLRAMKLDILEDTFQFEVTAAPGTDDHARITWTLATLKLNLRQSLVRQRRAAWQTWLGWLEDVVDAKTRGDAATLARLRDSLSSHNQPVVWAEMKRQRDELDSVRPLILGAPEVLSW